jgi:hypothetical protein
VNWQEFYLGDFTLTDSPIADFISSFPTAPSTTSGQINVYEVMISGSQTEETVIHFDLYDHVGSENHVKYKFAPFSHDGETTTGGNGFPPHGDGVPEPGSVLLWGLGAVGLGLLSRRRR